MFKKYKYWLPPLAIVLVYLSSRLANLTAIPIFTDEAIYLRWSQIMAHDAALRYLPLVDGKPPLFMWLTSFMMRLLNNFDPLLVGRLTAVFSGFLGLAGIVFAASVIFKKIRIGFLSGAVYLITPFTFFYDRFALADGLLAALGIWSVALGVIVARSKRLDAALICGLVIGLGLLTKTTALFFLAFIPLYFLVFDWRQKNLLTNIFKVTGLFIIVIFLSQAVFSILRLFQLFHMIGQKNKEFVVGTSEWLANPFHWIIGNLPSLLKWEFDYLTIGIVALVFGGLIIGLKRQFKREVLLLTALFIFPVLGIALINKVIYLRYLLPFTLPLIILAAVGLSELWARFPKKYAIPALIAIFYFPLFVNYKLLTKPVESPIPRADSDQYFNNWPAGFGVREVRAILKTEADKNSQVYVWTEGTFGLMPYALELYQNDYPNLRIRSFWPLPNIMPAEIKQLAQTTPVYLLVYQQKKDPSDDWKVTEIARFQQGTGPDFLRLYKVNP